LTLESFQALLWSMYITLLLLSLQAIGLSGNQASGQSGHQGHQAVKERGAHVMGFDQEKTRHSFRLHPDGGAVDISVKDPTDVTNRDAIRAHLPHIAQMFGDGNFEAPMLIHATKVPGTAKMTELKNRIRFVYVETPVGGRLDIFTTDAAALQAVHEFMRFQIADHKTGDTTAVTNR
jgi:hypothetical protein